MKSGRTKVGNKVAALFACAGVMLGVGATAGAQNSYVKVTGNLDLNSKLTERVELDYTTPGAGVSVLTILQDTIYIDNSSGNRFGDSEILYATTTPEWHANVAYGWHLTDFIDMESEVAYGQKLLNNIQTTVAPSNLIGSANGILAWDDKNDNDIVDAGEIQASDVTEDAQGHYGHMMFNMAYSPSLTDELEISLAAGLGFIFAGYSALSGSSFDEAGSSIMPGYQLKSSLIFEATANTDYLIEGGLVASFPGEMSTTRDAGNGLGDYLSTFQQFYVGGGIRYRF